MNPQAQVDVLLLIEDNIKKLEAIAALPATCDLLEHIRCATENPDIVRIIACDISSSHAARSPPVYQLKSIRGMSKKYFKTMLKNCCPSFDTKKLELYAELALKFDRDFWSGPKSRCLLGEDAKGVMLPTDSYCACEKLMSKR